MEPTEEQIAAKIAESAGLLSKEQARQIIISQAAHEAALNPTEEVEEEQTEPDGTVIKVKVTKPASKAAKKAARQA